MNNNLSVDKLLKQIYNFENDIHTALGILQCKENIINNDKIQLITDNIDLSSRKKSFEELLEMLEILKTILKTNYIFIDLDILSIILIVFNNRFKLNDKEIRNIIFSIFERNINNGILDDSTFIINKKYLLKYKDNFKININELKKIHGFKESSEILTKDIQVCHLIIKKCYFDKKQKSGELNKFTIEDLNKIEECLIKLNINSKIIDSIIRTLKDKIKEEIKVQTNIFTNNKSTRKLSKKEYYEIDSELRKYFYFDSNLYKINDLNNSIMIYNSLSEKEKMRCIFLLRKGGYGISTIETFLEKVELENLKVVNFLNLYNSDFKHMFNYFKDDYNLNELLEEINEILIILNSLEKNSQEYYEWMEELRKIVSMILNNIPKDKKREYTLKKVKDYELTENWK